MRRFLMHVLPDGFHRIRHYGLLAGAARAETVERIRQMIVDANGTAQAANRADERHAEETAETDMRTDAKNTSRAAAAAVA